MFLGFPGDSAPKEPACNVGDLGSIPGLGRSPGEGKGYLLQYSGLENSMDCIVHGVAKSGTQLSDFHFMSSILNYSCVSSVAKQSASKDRQKIIKQILVCWDHLQYEGSPFVGIKSSH